MLAIQLLAGWRLVPRTGGQLPHFSSSSRVAADDGALVVSSLDAASGVATIRMNHPAKLNAWTARMVTQLGGALRAARTDPRVRAAVYTGSGPYFCAGADASSLLDDDDGYARSRRAADQRDVAVRPRRRRQHTLLQTPHDAPPHPPAPLRRGPA